MRVFVNWAGILLALVGVVILIVQHALGIAAFPWPELTREIAIALIGAGVITFVVRSAIDARMESATIKAIEDTTDRQVALFGDTLRTELRRRTEFDPTATFASRSTTDDAVEREIRKLLPDTQMYTSFGVSGQFALVRLTDMPQISRTCSVKIIMADPQALDAKVFTDLDRIKRRIALCTQRLIERAIKRSWFLDISYSHPIPSLRFDIFGSDTFIYAFDDQHRPEGRPPDAARFSLGTQWDRSSRQMALDAERAASAGWRHGEGPWIIGESGRPEFFAGDSPPAGQAAALLKKLGLVPLTEDELTAEEKTLRKRLPK